MAISEEGVSFEAQMHDVRMKADGGGRMTIDFGRDALDEITWLQKQMTNKNHFQLAFIPMRFIKDGDDRVDSETGEIIFE